MLPGRWKSRYLSKTVSCFWHTSGSGAAGLYAHSIVIFSRTTRPFSAVGLFYFPSSSTWFFWVLICSFFLLSSLPSIAILDMKRLLIEVLISISLMISKVSIFSCVYWPLAYLLCTNIYSSPLLIFKPENSPQDGEHTIGLPGASGVLDPHYHCALFGRPWCEALD